MSAEKLISKAESLQPLLKVVESSLEPAQKEQLLFNLSLILITLLATLGAKHSRSLRAKQGDIIHADGMLKAMYQAVTPFVALYSIGTLLQYNFDIDGDMLQYIFGTLGVMAGLANTHTTPLAQEE